MRELVAKLMDGSTLTEDEASQLVDGLTSDELDPALAAAALTAMRVRGETAEELRAFARGLQEKANRPPIPDVTAAVDIVGTGGDASGSLNLSTGAALLAAAAGEKVIKHGNRSVSSQSGSFDVLAAMGFDVPWDSDRAADVFDRTGFTYLFAPAFHPSMKAVAPIRQTLGSRTIFNLVGPLANPARTPRLVIGAFSTEFAAMMAETLSGMSIDRAYVVHGEPGWDEPTPVGPYVLFEVSPGQVIETTEDPADFGIPRCSSDDLVGGNPETNARAISAVFAGENGPHRDALVLGASLAMRLGGVTPDEAMARARRALDDGSASRLVEDVRDAGSGGGDGG